MREVESMLRRGDFRDTTPKIATRVFVVRFKQNPFVVKNVWNIRIYERYTYILNDEMLNNIIIICSRFVVNLF